MAQNRHCASLNIAFCWQRGTSREIRRSRGRGWPLARTKSQAQNAPSRAIADGAASGPVAQNPCQRCLSDRGYPGCRHPQSLPCRSGENNRRGCPIKRLWYRSLGWRHAEQNRRRSKLVTSLLNVSEDWFSSTRPMTSRLSGRSRGAY